MLLVDLQTSSHDDLVEVTLVELTNGSLVVTFLTHRSTSSVDVGDVVDKVTLRSNETNISDGEWHRIEITRYDRWGPDR